MLPLSLIALLLAQPPAAPAPAAPLDWKTLEAPYLSDHTQLTLPDRFLKAGEAYFDHFKPARWIVFQAVERPKPGDKPESLYSMYTAKLGMQDDKACLCLTDITRISPEGSANTCAWFAPLSQEDAYGRILFASTLKAPNETVDKPGYQRGTSRYTWSFYPEMTLVQTTVAQIRNEIMEEQHGHDAAMTPSAGLPVAPVGVTLPKGQDYSAECSWSPAGRSLIFSYMVDPASKNLDLYVWDRETKTTSPLIQAPGYDGGPFFSPDGKWICYRSDRKGDNNLQLFVAELAFDDKDQYMGGRITGIKHEYQLTGLSGDEQIVSWCPYWHPSMKYMVYATSAVAHTNYEVFAIEFDADKVRASEGKALPALRRTRITSADGFDGLPVFSDDGALMMWTSQRGPKVAGEEKPSSQLWIANLKGEPNWDKK